MSGWKRPDSVSFPRIWRRIPGFIIQDMTPEREKEAFEHIEKYFLRDEPTCKPIGLINEAQSVNEFMEIVRHSYQSGYVSLVGIEEATNKLAGVNIMGVVQAETSQEVADDLQELKETFKGEQVLKVLKLLHQCYVKGDAYKHFGVNLTLDSLALSVHPDYRQRGLGKEMVWARLEMAKELGIPVTQSIFTSNYSQRIAEQTGLETLAEIRYDEFLNPDGTPILGYTLPHVSAKLMAGIVPTSVPPPLPK